MSVAGGGKRNGLAASLMVGGAIALAIVSFLHWYGASSFWKLDQSLHLKIVMVALVVITIALSLASTSRGGVWPRLAGAAGLFTGGGVVSYTLEVSSFHPKIAAYIALVFGVVIAAGGLLAGFDNIAGAVANAAPAARPQSAPVKRVSPEPEARTTSPPATDDQTMQPPNPADLTETINTSVPTGWYADPSGEHSERLWDGSAWTHEVR